MLTEKERDNNRIELTMNMVKSVGADLLAKVQEFIGIQDRLYELLTSKETSECGKISSNSTMRDND